MKKTSANTQTAKRKKLAAVPGRLFPDEWLLGFEDSHDRMIEVVRRYIERRRSVSFPMFTTHHAEAIVLAKLYLREQGQPAIAWPSFDNGINPKSLEQIEACLEHVRDIAATARSRRNLLKSAESLETHFAALFDKSQGYELSEQQFTELQRLINELRTKITAASTLSDDHRARMLRRVEKLQSELHKKLSTVEQWYGATVELLVMAQNLTDKAKPVVDTLLKIFAIIWAAQSHKDGLGLPPSSIPLYLPPASTDGPKSLPPEGNPV